MTPRQRNIFAGVFALAFVASFGFLIYAMYVDSESKKDQPPVVAQQVEEFPLNEAIWYQFYRCEINRLYYELKYNRTKSKKDADMARAWETLRRRHMGLKDNKTLTQAQLDEEYLRIWRLERGEMEPPDMPLLHAAQAAANESAPLIWHKDSK